METLMICARQVIEVDVLIAQAYPFFLGGGGVPLTLGKRQSRRRKVTKFRMFGNPRPAVTFYPARLRFYKFFNTSLASMSDLFFFNEW
jgi:hypothetical protein